MLFLTSLWTKLYEVCAVTFAVLVLLVFIRAFISLLIYIFFSVSNVNHIFCCFLNPTGSSQELLHIPLAFFQTLFTLDVPVSYISRRVLNLLLNFNWKACKV